MSLGSDDAHGCNVMNDKLVALERVTRAQWHVGSAGLEDAENDGHHVERLVENQRDSLARSDTQADELGGNQVGTLIQLAVGEHLLSVPVNGGSSWVGLRNAFKLGVQKLGLRNDQLVSMRESTLNQVPLLSAHVIQL
ncbi:hypothetical protein CDD83_6261 [Cordyceps sp. RAO-2017]|nr:hypothetical protein CDD83_6261 [Cordyceps sp. RAO-2017]